MFFKAFSQLLWSYQGPGGGTFLFNVNRQLYVKLRITEYSMGWYQIVRACCYRNVLKSREYALANHPCYCEPANDAHENVHM